jgi:hypothetical protein
MKSQYNRNRRLWVLAIVPALVFLVAASAVSTKKVSRQSDDLPLVNKTQALEVTRFEKREQAFQIAMKNNYTKNITAYVMGLTGEHSSTTVTEDFIQGTKMIAPGQMFENRFFYVPAYHNWAQAFSILAVVFEDNSGDGDEIWIRQIQRSRAGVRIFLTQVLPLMTEFTNLGDNDASERLELLLLRIEKMEPAGSTKLPDDVVGSYNSARESCLRELDKIKGEVYPNKLLAGVRIREADAKRVLARLK